MRDGDVAGSKLLRYHHLFIFGLRSRNGHLPALSCQGVEDEGGQLTAPISAWYESIILPTHTCMKTAEISCPTDLVRKWFTHEPHSSSYPVVWSCPQERTWGEGWRMQLHVSGGWSFPVLSTPGNDACGARLSRGIYQRIYTKLFAKRGQPTLGSLTQSRREYSDLDRDLSRT